MRRCPLPEPANSTNGSWAQPIWTFDPLNRTGKAKDSNDGLTDTTPLLTFAECVDRCGTRSPTLDQDTTFKFLSGSPLDGSDPVVFSPVMTTRSKASLYAPLGAAQKIGSGVLSGVAARDYAAGTLLQAVLSSAGAVGTDMFVVNTTVGKESAAWTNLDLGGGAFSLSQPFTRTTHALAFIAYVDTWANGDTFDVYLPEAVEIASFCPFVTSLGVHKNTEIYNILFADVIGTYFETSRIASGTYVQECRLDRNVLVETPMAQKVFFNNCDNNSLWGAQGGIPQGAQAQGITSSLPGIRILGGMVANFGTNLILDDNVIIRSPYGVACVSGGSFIGTAYVETAISTSGVVVLAAHYTDGPRLWGPGSLNVDGRLSLGASAVSSLLLKGAITLAGDATAFSATKANPSVIVGNVAITPASIDAAIAAGVGLWHPAGAAIVGAANL